MSDCDIFDTRIGEDRCDVILSFYISAKDIEWIDDSDQDTLFRCCSELACLSNWKCAHFGSLGDGDIKQIEQQLIGNIESKIIEGVLNPDSALYTIKTTLVIICIILVIFVIITAVIFYRRLMNLNLRPDAPARQQN